MIKKALYPGFLALLITLPVLLNNLKAQDIPGRPVPPRLVNDFSGMLSRQEVNALEQKLVAFNDSTSTQIAVVTVQTLDGYDIVDYADRLAEKWGIGQKGLDNGILVLIKPKTARSGGEVTIRVAYGLEGAIPDLTASEIIDREMLPAFRNSDFYGGLDRATSTLMSLAGGEFTAEQYGQRRPGDNREGDFPAILIVLIIIIVIVLSLMGKRGGRGGRLTSGSDLPFWLLMSMLGSGGKSHSGSWGGFSGGGGSRGGFGGFGGGSFGGGGARGSW